MNKALCPDMRYFVASPSAAKLRGRADLSRTGKHDSVVQHQPCTSCCVQDDAAVETQTLGLSIARILKIVDRIRCSSRNRG